jgi:hypothetical protein
MKPRHPPIGIACLALLVCCDGELRERIRGPVLIKTPCSELDGEGFPVESRFPYGMFCHEGICSPDHGGTNDETHWYSLHCRDSTIDPNNGDVTLALLPFDPSEYQWEDEVVEPDGDFPIALYCIEPEDGVSCMPGLVTFDYDEGGYLNHRPGSNSYTLADWAKIGEPEVIGVWAEDDPLELRGAFPLVYQCEDAEEGRGCFACVSWTIQDEQLVLSCPSPTPDPEFLIWWLS